jgi:hypothetical protein
MCYLLIYQLNQDANYLNAPIKQQWYSWLEKKNQVCSFHDKSFYTERCE